MRDVRAHASRTERCVTTKDHQAVLGSADQSVDCRARVEQRFLSLRPQQRVLDRLAAERDYRRQLAVQTGGDRTRRFLGGGRLGRAIDAYKDPVRLPHPPPARATRTEQGALRSSGRSAPPKRRALSRRCRVAPTAISVADCRFASATTHERSSRRRTARIRLDQFTHELQLLAGGRHQLVRRVPGVETRVCGQVRLSDRKVLQIATRRGQAFRLRGSDDALRRNVDTGEQ